LGGDTAPSGASPLGIAAPATGRRLVQRESGEARGGDAEDASSSRPISQEAGQPIETFVVHAIGLPWREIAYQVDGRAVAPIVDKLCQRARWERGSP
jgi:hypothetical protein